MMIQELIARIEAAATLANNVAAICYANNKVMSQSRDIDTRRNANALYVGSTRAYHMRDDLLAIVNELRAFPAIDAQLELPLNVVVKEG